jgi:hypothetical protein
MMTLQEAILDELRALRAELASHNLQDATRFTHLDRAIARLGERVTRNAVKTNTLWAVAGALSFLAVEYTLGLNPHP